MVQSCGLTFGSGTVTGAMALKLQDWTGQIHHTRAITLTHATTTSLGIQEAIQALPNNVFETVTVGTLTSSATGDWAWTITFTSAENTGTIPLVQIVLGNTTTDDHGNQPLLADVGASISAASCSQQTAATTEALVCSGRGNCQSDLGLCQCGRGYYGRACEYQTSIQ